LETILVTGGFGYIGSHTCVSLLENNYNILIVDSLVNSSKDTLDKIKKTIALKGFEINDNIQFLEGDLRDKLWLDNVFGDYLKSDKPIKSVIHFAGLKSIYDSIISPIDYWDANISTTISLILIMKKYQCFSLIFSSSASVYAANGMKLLKETDIVKPETPYGKTKLCIEEILHDLYFSDTNWRIASLRYFNPIGSHNLGLLPEDSKGKSANLFPAILRTIMGNQKRFLIYGKDWPTEDGTCIRDFIHVMDLAEAHVAALRFLKDNKPQNIAINIGTGKGTSVFEIIKTFQEVNGISFLYDFVERRIGDQPFLVADNKLALDLLDWLPRRNIVDMCTDSVKNLL
tara:strand:+ start:409 stop:1440 length:1032 start_codon:yes stop_codon:yes gene_type:complete